MSSEPIVPESGTDRATLWRSFLLDAGASPDQHPVALFGKPVVDRIFAGASIWHWRQLAWPALVALGTLLVLSAAYALRLPGGGLYSAFGVALAMLAFLAAHHLWNDYMRALEAASVHEDIVPFTEFLAERIRNPTKE